MRCFDLSLHLMFEDLSGSSFNKFVMIDKGLYFSGSSYSYIRRAGKNTLFGVVNSHRLEYFFFTKFFEAGII